MSVSAVQGAAVEQKRSYNLPSGDAATTLNQFAGASGQQIVFMMEKVKGERTNAVAGDYAAHDALDRMLAGTGLSATRDPATGAFVVSRKRTAEAAPRTGEVGPVSDPQPEPKTSPMKSPRTLFAIIASWFTLAAASADGQTPNAITGAVTAKEETLVLSPFSVSSERDFGYQASNSITATGIGTPIRDIPANINVITRDFLTDRAFGEMRYAVHHVSSVNTDNRDTNRNTVKVRGFNALVQQNGVDESFLEMANVDRVEIIKGPSSVFHGIVRPGGVVNIIKAVPEFRASNYAELRVGSYDYLKGEIRSTGPLVKDRLAYNIFYSYRDQDRRPDYSYDHVKFGSAGLQWQPNARLTSLLDFEIKEEKYSGIHSLPVTHPAYLRAVDAGQVPYRQTARAWLDANPTYGPNEPLAQIFVTDRMFRTARFNPNGPESPTTEEGYTVRSETTLRATERLNLRLLVAQTDIERDLVEMNTFRPVAGQRPGELIFDSRFNEVRSATETLVVKLEGTASFQNRFLKQTFVVGSSAIDNRSYSQNVNGPLRPWNPLTEPIRLGLTEMNSAFPGGKPALPPKLKASTRSYYISDQVAAFSERLRLLIGMRHTRAENATGLKQAKTTPQFGALFRPVGTVGVYANYSETFEPNYLVDGLGNQVGPTVGKGSEVGVKLEPWGERLSASIALYSVERSNIPRRDQPQEALTGIRPIYILGGLERNEGVEIDFTFSPARNYQLVGSYTHSWLHKTVASTGDVRQVGVSIENVPDHAFNLWNKYTFTTGRLKGLALGGGVKASSSMNLHPSWDVPLRGEGYISVDALVAYTRKLSSGTLQVQLNLENLTSERYTKGVYLISDPITSYLSLRYAF